VIAGTNIQDGEHVLDVGCGTATLLIAAKSRSPLAQMVGVDPDKRALAIAHKEIAQHQVEVAVVQAGAEHVPFPTSCFVLGMSTLVFHHLPTEIKHCAMPEIACAHAWRQVSAR
jgi:ubiquinone/menaquinone biosynthesis C-methylase UbiE